MRPRWTPPPAMRWVVTATALVMIGYLAMLALKPSIIDALPAWLSWFGRPGSMLTIAIVVAMFIAVCYLTVRSGGSHPDGVHQAAAGLQSFAAWQHPGRGRSLVPIQPNPSRLHTLRRHTVPPER